MQETITEKLDPNQDSFTETKLMTHQFAQQLNFRDGVLYNDDDDDVEEQEIEAVNSNRDSDEEDEDDGEFSFMCGEINQSAISAEEAFINGQIKPGFLFFNRDFTISAQDLPIRPPVNHVFVETRDEMTSDNDVIVGPYCDWSNSKVVEVSSTTSPRNQGCKKSNSTGFSKIFRFKELMGRSNSDGRDAFVFLNNDSCHAPPLEEAPVKLKEEKNAVKESSREVNKVSKRKTTPLSAHEVYLKSKAEAGGRRRSYLPYRPQLTGFFTNVNGGLTRNVHPF